MYFEAFKSETLKCAPLGKDPYVTYVVNEGPNGSGKSAVSSKAAEISLINLLTTTDIYWAEEPPAINLPQLPDGIDARRFLKGGMAGLDVREQLGVFMLSRRKLQEGVHGGKIVEAEGLTHVGTSNLPESRSIVFSDRGMPSSFIYQVRGEITYGGVERARENAEAIETAYRNNYLLAYDLVTFIYPRGAKSTYNPEDFWEGKYDEVKLYGEEIRARGQSCFYSNNIIWVENDPITKTNLVEEPAICTAAATMAVVRERQLTVGKRYEVPFVLPGSVWEKLQGMKEIRSGNIVVNFHHCTEIRLEISERLPQQVEYVDAKTTRSQIPIPASS